MNDTIDYGWQRCADNMSPEDVEAFRKRMEAQHEPESE